MYFVSTLYRSISSQLYLQLFGQLTADTIRAFVDIDAACGEEAAEGYVGIAGVPVALRRVLAVGETFEGISHSTDGADGESDAGPGDVAELQFVNL